MEDVNVLSELRESRINWSAFFVCQLLEEVRHIVHDVLRDYLQELRKVARVVAVHVHVEVDGLEHLHEDEGLRNRDQEDEGGHSCHGGAHGS